MKHLTSIAAIALFMAFVFALGSVTPHRKDCPREPNDLDLAITNPGLKDACGLSVIRPYPYPEVLPYGTPLSSELAKGLPL